MEPLLNKDVKMTDYCTKEQVQSRFKSLNIASNSSINTTEVNSFIALNSSLIDSMLESAYTTPITGTESLNIMQLICELLTVADILEILPQGTNREENKKKIDNADRYRNRAHDLLEKIKKGKIALTDASSKTGDAFYNYNVAHNLSATIKKSETQW